MTQNGEDTYVLRIFFTNDRLPLIFRGPKDLLEEKVRQINNASSLLRLVLDDGEDMRWVNMDHIVEIALSLS